jgi:hypothetical protein
MRTRPRLAPVLDSLNGRQHPLRLLNYRERGNYASDFDRLGRDALDRRVLRNKRNRTEGGPNLGRSTGCGSEHRGRACRGIAHNVSFYAAKKSR